MHLMPINLDRHLDDPLTDRDYRAIAKREEKVRERTKEILGSISEIESLLRENPHTVAKFLRPVMGEDYWDYVPELRAYIRGLAADVAELETPIWEEFR